MRALSILITISAVGFAGAAAYQEDLRLAVVPLGLLALHFGIGVRAAGAMPGGAAAAGENTYLLGYMCTLGVLLGLSLKISGPLLFAGALGLSTSLFGLFFVLAARSERPGPAVDDSNRELVRTSEKLAQQLANLQLPEQLRSILTSEVKLALEGVTRLGQSADASHKSVVELTGACAPLARIVQDLSGNFATLEKVLRKGSGDLGQQLREFLGVLEEFRKLLARRIEDLVPQAGLEAMP